MPYGGMNESTRVQLGEAHVVRIYADDGTGVAVTGTTLTLKVRRDGDGFWFNGTTFQSSATSVNMSELDSTNMAGIYVYTIPAAALSQPANLCYLVETSDASVKNDPWWGEIKVGGWVDYINSDLQEISAATVFVPTVLANTNYIRTSVLNAIDAIQGVFRAVQEVVSKLSSILVRNL